MPLLLKVPNGQYLDIVSARRTWLQSHLAAEGLAGYEPHTQAAILSLCEGHAGPIIFYDLGSHFGFYAALVQMTFPDALCVAFEPTPATAAMARRVFQANTLPVDLVEKAVSDFAGTTELFLSPKAETSNSLDPGFRPGSLGIAVEVVTVDGIVAGGRPPPSLMKVDVESLEAKVLAGGLETIRKSRPVIVCELLDDSKRGEMDRILEALAGLGYSFYHANGDSIWPRYDAGAVMSHATFHEFADWVLSPIDLSRTFFQSVRRWRTAVDACTPDTNIVIKGLQVRPARPA